MFGSTDQHGKVCFVHGQLGLGGAEVLRLSVLQEMQRQGIHAEVLQLRQAGPLTAAVKQLGVPVTTLNNRGGLVDIVGIYKLRKFLRQNQFDIVQSSQFVTNLQTSLACRSLGRQRHVIEEHGIYKWKKSYHRWLDRTFNARAAAVIACSAAVAASAGNDLNLTPDKIDVVHNCVGAEHLQPIDHQWKTSAVGQASRAAWVGSTPVQHLTGIVGTLRWEKGHRFLFDAWRQLQQAGKLSPGHHLLIVGDGPLRNDLPRAAAGLNNVHFLGSIEEPRRVLRDLDLFVLPSANEGFGIAIIEAMAAGVPVIGSDSGGIPEVISAGTGVLVPAENAPSLATAMEMFLSPNAGHDIAQAARKRVEAEFSPAVYVQRLGAIYRRIYDESGPG